MILRSVVEKKYSKGLGRERRWGGNGRELEKIKRRINEGLEGHEEGKEEVEMEEEERKKME